MTEAAPATPSAAGATARPTQDRAGAPVGAVDVALALGLGLLAFRLYRQSAPAQVNLDGLGYLKLLPYNFSAGHLLYMPLLRAVTAWQGGQALLAGRKLDAGCAAAAVGLTVLLGSALSGRRAGLLAGVGLGLSYGVWVQGSDVECYAPALLSLLSLLALLCAWRARPSIESALAVGLAAALAVLTHLTHLMALPLVATWMVLHGGWRRGLGQAALALCTTVALVAACYAHAAFAVRRTDAAGLLRWVATAQHGFAYRGSPLERLSDSAYGLSRALVWSPYLDESNAQALLSQFLLGLAALATLVAAVVVDRRRRPLACPPGISTVALLSWVVPYAATGLAFFGSDHERWLFVLPPLWLAAAEALAASWRGLLLGATLCAALGLINQRTAIAPAMAWTWDQTRADAATEPMRDGDLVVFPGHSWDEYVGFHSGRKVVPLPLSYHAGVLGKAGCERRLAGDLRGAYRRGARAFVLRLFDPPPSAEAGAEAADDRGFYELRQLGLDRAALRALFAGHRLIAVPTSQPSVTVYRVEPPGAP